MLIAFRWDSFKIISCEVPWDGVTSSWLLCFSMMEAKLQAMGHFSWTWVDAPMVMET